MTAVTLSAIGKAISGEKHVEQIDFLRECPIPGCVRRHNRVRFSRRMEETERSVCEHFQSYELRRGDGVYFRFDQ